MPSGVPRLSVRLLPAAKPCWRSRTLWLNLALLAFALAALTTGMPVSDTALLALVGAAAVANLVLRARTDRAVTWQLPQQPGEG
jgi:predicted membrane metal-binding protein